MTEGAFQSEMSDLDADDRIRVLFFTDADYTGGAEKYIYYLTRYLPCRKHVVIDGDPGPERLKDWLEEIDVPFTELPGGKVTDKVRDLFRVFRKLQPDILHINLPGPFDAYYSMVALLARLAGIRNIVTTEHLPMFSPFLKSRVLKSIATMFIDCVITVSRDNRKHLISKHNVPERKIRVVYNGIPDPAEAGVAGKSNLPGGGGVFRMAVIGSLLEKKGQREAIEALKELDENIHLYIAGEGEMEEELIRVAGECGVRDRVHFMGYVDDVFELLDSMDVLIVPSSVEATPYTVIEGMAVGVPVIASNIFGIPEMIEDGKTGFLIERANLVSAVRLLFENSSLRKDISSEARCSYESKFRVEKSVNETLNIYREIMLEGKMKH